MISGFMIVKDVLKPGYPFVEAIAAALPICDEFLLSDGYSVDGTFEIVERIAKLNKKIKIFRHKWSTAKKLTVLAEVTNELRKECKYDYMLSVQANEIIHEESAGFIKALPEMLPQTFTFSFPYFQMLANHKFAEEFRLRFSKNLPGIIAIGDAWSLGASKDFIRSEELKSLKNPRKFLRYIGTGIELTYANSVKSIFSKPVYLPKPVFRYWSLFPRNFLEKCVRHAEMFDYPGFHTFIDALKEHMDEPSAFWKLASELFRETDVGVKYPEALGVVNEGDHPALIRDFITDSGLKSYYVREEVLDSIRSL